MKDGMKSCQHTLSDDVVYKEVVVIGNGPSGMVTSFMLAGNVPYLKKIPEDLPIDDMLRARLSNLPEGQSLYETDLTELAEGLEGRSQNPIPLLMDNLLKPCADLGFQADSLIEWRYDVEKQIDHIVLGRGPPGGSWHTFPPSVLTLSPAAWLVLPPHDGAAAPPAAPATPAAPAGPAPPTSPALQRLSARAVAKYCRRYVQACKIQRYFRSGVIVNSVTRLPPPKGPRCPNANCSLNANFCVTGYDKSERRMFRYTCGRVVVACGGADRPNALGAGRALAAHSLAAAARAVRLLADHADHAHHAHHAHHPSPPTVMVVGSGVSAADGVWLALARGGLRVAHVHRAPAEALARLSARDYPDYCQVYQMMCDGTSGNHKNYTSYPDHMILDVKLEPNAPPSHKLNSDDIEEYSLRPKRVTLLNLTTNETTVITVSLLAVFIGSKPDLFFLQTNFNFDCIEKPDCIKCTDEIRLASKRKIDEKQCFLKNHWHYLKSVLGQSIQSCKSRYLNYTEINGNTDTKCVLPVCNKRGYDSKCTCNLISKLENGVLKVDKECKCNNIPYTETIENKTQCQCQPSNPYSSGIGYGIDPSKPVDGRSNPVAIDKSSHEMLNAPKGMYALGPLTADNFVRFIPGGALAIVAHIHKENKMTIE